MPHHAVRPHVIPVVLRRLAAGASGPVARRCAAVVALAALGACASRPALRPVPVRPAPIAAPPLEAPAPAVPVAPLPAEIAAPVTAFPLPAPPADEPLSSAAVESAGVAARFPDPDVNYATPAFEAGHDGFTSNAELQAQLRRLVRDGGTGSQATTIRLIVPGVSQAGVPLEALYFTRDPDAAAALPVRPARPNVLLIGQQHGDEPAGSEALLVIAQQLASGGKLQAVLDHVNVVILPRANPDGAATGRRLTAGGIDANRDHLLLKSPEAQAQAQLVRDYAPLVVVDAHEYTAAGRYVEKFAAVQRFDALLQYAMTANVHDFVTKASEEWFRRPLVARLKGAGLTAEWYYTTSADPGDNKLSMGGAQPDNGRNVNGLKNAVSILIETRGIGLGRAHLKRRVYTHVTAISGVLESAAARAGDLVRLRQFVDADVSAKACQGDTTVEAEATPSEYDMLMLDPATGADKTVSVSWDSTLVLTPKKIRTRPCGYWLASEQADAVMRLRALGVRVQQVEELGVMRGESYREVARDTAPRGDPRGSMADPGGVVKVSVATVPALIDAAVGSYYVGLDQPFANLVVAALEPDTPSSYVAHRIIDRVGATVRVMARPEMRLAVMP